MLIERTTLLELADRLHIPEYAIAAYFEENREAFRTPPRIAVRHILLQAPPRAQKIATRLRGGADFEALAREESVAPEADAGGLLPPFAAGDMPEAFDRARELPVGGLSEVIESPFGYHLFRVEKQLPAQGEVLENAHDEIRRLLEQRRLEELRRNWLRRLRRTAMINVNEPLLETLR